MLLGFGLLLLVAYQVFNHGGLGNVLIILMVEQLLLLSLLFLGVVYILLYFFSMGSFVVHYFLSLLLLLSLMQQCYLRLFVQFHLLPKLFLICVLHVTSALVHNVASLSSSLFDFLECTALLLFEQLNSVSQ